MEQIVDRVARWVLSRAEREIPARWIGEKVVKELRLLDNVAYVRFASVYRDFKDVHEFVSALEQDPDQVGPDIDDNGDLLKLTPPQ